MKKLRQVIKYFMLFLLVGIVFINSTFATTIFDTLATINTDELESIGGSTVVGGFSKEKSKLHNDTNINITKYNSDVLTASEYSYALNLIYRANCANASKSRIEYYSVNNGKSVSGSAFTCANHARYIKELLDWYSSRFYNDGRVYFNCYYTQALQIIKERVSNSYNGQSLLLNAEEYDYAMDLFYRANQCAETTTNNAVINYYSVNSGYSVGALFNCSNHYQYTKQLLDWYSTKFYDGGRVDFNCTWREAKAIIYDKIENSQDKTSIDTLLYNLNNTDGFSILQENKSVFCLRNGQPLGKSNLAINRNHMATGDYTSYITTTGDTYGTYKIGSVRPIVSEDYFDINEIGKSQKIKSHAKYFIEDISNLFDIDNGFGRYNSNVLAYSAAFSKKGQEGYTNYSTELGQLGIWGTVGSTVGEIAEAKDSDLYKAGSALDEYEEILTKNISGNLVEKHQIAIKGTDENLLNKPSIEKMNGDFAEVTAGNNIGSFGKEPTGTVIIEKDGTKYYKVGPFNMSDYALAEARDGVNISAYSGSGLEYPNLLGGIISGEVILTDDEGTIVSTIEIGNETEKAKITYKDVNDNTTFLGNNDYVGQYIQTPRDYIFPYPESIFYIEIPVASCDDTAVEFSKVSFNYRQTKADGTGWVIKNKFVETTFVAEREGINTSCRYYCRYCANNTINYYEKDNHMYWCGITGYCKFGTRGCRTHCGGFCNECTHTCGSACEEGCTHSCSSVSLNYCPDGYYSGRHTSETCGGITLCINHEHKECYTGTWNVSSIRMVTGQPMLAVENANVDVVKRKITTTLGVRLKTNVTIDKYISKIEIASEDNITESEYTVLGSTTERAGMTTLNKNNNPVKIKKGDKITYSIVLKNISGKNVSLQVKDILPNYCIVESIKNLENINLAYSTIENSGKYNNGKFFVTEWIDVSANSEVTIEVVLVVTSSNSSEYIKNAATISSGNIGRDVGENGVDITDKYFNYMRTSDTYGAVVNSAQINGTNFNEELISVEYAIVNEKTFEEEGVEISTNDESGKAVITDKTDEKEELEVPSETTDETTGVTYDVVGIGAYAFYGDSTLKTVIIPEDILSVGEAAFANCNNLTDVYFYTNDANTAEKQVLEDGIFNNCSENLTLHVRLNSTAHNYAISNNLNYDIIDAASTEIGGVTYGYLEFEEAWNNAEENGTVTLYETLEIEEETALDMENKTIVGNIENNYKLDISNGTINGTLSNNYILTLGNIEITSDTYALTTDVEEISGVQNVSAISTLDEIGTITSNIVMFNINNDTVLKGKEGSISDSVYAIGAGIYTPTGYSLLTEIEGEYETTIVEEECTSVIAIANQTVEEKLYGDIDGDGFTTERDCNLFRGMMLSDDIKLRYFDSDGDGTMSAAEEEACVKCLDVNEDGLVDIRDMTRLKRMVENQVPNKGNDFYRNETVQFAVITEPENQKVTWSVVDLADDYTELGTSNRATIDEKTGEFKALQKGLVKVIATPKTNSAISDSITINIVEYQIEYDLNEGNLPEGKTNPTSYTIEDRVVLNNPVKRGHTFTGWTGSNGNTPQTRVEIPIGTKGDKTYKANYSINSYTLEVRYVDEEGEELAEAYRVVLDYNTPYNISNPVIDGYTATKEYTNGTMEDMDTVISIIYKANPDTPYTVEHYLQDIDDPESYTKKETETNYGATKKLTSAEAKEYEGYTAKKIEQQTILADGSTVVKVYYVRMGFEYKVEYYYDNVLDTENTEIDVESFEKVVNTYTDKVKAGYEFEKVENLPLTISSVVEENIIKVYYVRKDAEISIKYKDFITNEEISEEVTKVQKVFDEYDVTAEEKEIEGYTIIEKPANIKGKYTEEKQEIVFKYAKNTSVEINYLEKGSNKVLSEKDIIEGYESKEYEITEKQIEGYTLVENSENTKGIMSREKIVVNYYYLKNTKVIINHIDKNTNNILKVVEEDGLVGDNFKATSIDINGYVLVESPENESVIMTEEYITLNYYYANVSRGVVEKHINRVTNEIISNKTYDGNEGDDYTTTPMENEEYVLIEEKLPSNAEGTMKKEVVTVAYFYYRKTSVKVLYIDKVTNDVIEENIIEGYETQAYKTEAKEFEGYNLTETPKGAEGSMKVSLDTEGNVITETVLAYYYQKDSRGVIERHYDAITNELLEPEKLHEGYEGDTYKINPKEFEGYALVEEKMPTNAEGTMTEEQIIVNYYYKRTATIKVEYIDVITNEKVIEDIILTKFEGEAYKTERKTFEKYILLEDRIPENEEGTIVITQDEEGNLIKEFNVKYYYVHESEGVEEKHIDIITGDLLEDKITYSGVEGTEYKTEQKAYEKYDIVEEKIPLNAEGKMTRELIEVNYYYIRKATVKVEYLEKETDKKLEKDIIINGHEGDEYKTEEKEFAGYKLASKTENAEGKMTRDDITVTYYYELIKAEDEEKEDGKQEDGKQDDDKKEEGKEENKNDNKEEGKEDNKPEGNNGTNTEGGNNNDNQNAGTNQGQNSSQGGNVQTGTSNGSTSTSGTNKNTNTVTTYITNTNTTNNSSNNATTEQKSEIISAENDMDENIVKTGDSKFNVAIGLIAFVIIANIAVSVVVKKKL